MATDIYETSFWCIPRLDRLEMLCARNVIVSSPRHTHETLTIGIVEEGIALLKYKGDSYSMRSGCVAIVNPDDAHACYPQNPIGYSQRVIYPSLTLLERATYELTGRSHLMPLFDNPIAEDRAILKQLQHLFRTLQHSSCALEQETQLLDTLITLIRAYAKIPPVCRRELKAEPKVISQIREYLEANYAENISLSQLATLTYLSPFHLSRIFCETVGLPPYLYLTQVRVLRAKKLLSQGKAIAQVAQEVGFAHQSHLNRHFKKIVGVTPKQYQNSKNVQD